MLIIDQGGQIMDNALCGGEDSGAGISNTAVPISASAVNMIKAAIFMGDPRYRAGLPYNVGTCSAQGVSYKILYHGAKGNCTYRHPHPLHR